MKLNKSSVELNESKIQDDQSDVNEFQDYVLDFSPSLNDLFPTIRKKTRVGRGHGSGLGKTCGRGISGQKSRSGASLSPSFCGGQSPFHKTTPKFIRINAFKPKVYEVNVQTILSKCDGLNSIYLVVKRLNIPFYYRYLRIVGNLNQLPFKIERQINLSSYKK